MEHQEQLSGSFDLFKLQPEVNEENKFYLIDIARLISGQQSPQLDYKSDSAELHMEQLTLVKQDEILLQSIQWDKAKFTYQTLQENLLKIYYKVYNDLIEAQKMIQRIFKTMKNRRIEKFIENNHQGESIAMVLIFYLGIQNDNEMQIGSKFIHELRNDPDVQPSIHEVKYWINKAIADLQKYYGECSRAVQIDDQNQADYYQTSKIFCWNQFSSAYKKNIASDLTNQSNFIFHIFGFTCTDVSIFSSEANKDLNNVVLFGLQTEFLVCDRVLGPDQKWHIYLREVKTGLSKNVLIWVDDEIFPIQNNKNSERTYKTYNYIHQQCQDQNLHIILKTSTDTATAYLQSPLFKGSLQYCDQFKVATDIYRANEPEGRSKELAGPNFLKNFRNFTKDYQQINKVKTMIFCGDVGNAEQKLEQAGFEKQDYPKIVTKPEDFIKFALSHD